MFFRITNPYTNAAGLQILPDGNERTDNTQGFKILILHAAGLQILPDGNERTDNTQGFKILTLHVCRIINPAGRKLQILWDEGTKYNIILIES
jgi:hypothetical protein